MIRFFFRTVLSLLANAVGLLAAALLLDGFSVNSFAFVVAVGIFTLATAVLGPFITKVALKNADYLVGGIALVNTFVALLLTSLFSSGISIDGLSTWVLATLIVWLFSMIGSLVLPLFLFKKALDNKRED